MAAAVKVGAGYDTSHVVVLVASHRFSSPAVYAECRELKINDYTCISTGTKDNVTLGWI